MYYAKIIDGDLINGYGCGVTLFVSGCTLKCPGCYNEAAWDFTYGDEFTDETLDEILELMSKPYIDHFSVLGGEPLDQKNIKVVTEVCEIVKLRYPDKKIWIWSGLKSSIAGKGLMSLPIAKYIDVLITGEYKQELPTNKLYRGSDNQIMFIKENNRWIKHD